MDVSDIGGTVILLLTFIALEPLMTTAINILTPNLGPTETLIASSIPLVLLLLILIEPWNSNEIENQIGR
jgi:hypothetical protein